MEADTSSLVSTNEENESQARWRRTQTANGSFVKPSRLPRWRRLSGAISRRSSAGTLLVGWTQRNNWRNIDAGSRKPARCLQPESDAPDVFQSLTEELKCGKPCYSFQNSNIVILQGFKEFCALLFAKGALLSDPKSILEKPGENTQAARRIPFTSVREIVEMEPVLKASINEAIEVENAGLQVTYKKNPEPIPEELQKKLDESPAFKTAFAALTPGRQRGYILYFSAAKQSKTRESRVEKWRQQILKGKGLND